MCPAGSAPAGPTVIGQRTPSRCSIASWSRASMATLRARSASRSYDAARRSSSDSPSADASGCVELADPGGLQRRGDLGVGAEGLDLLAQDQVVAHAAARGLPDAVHRLGARRLEVEVHVAVVAPWPVPAPSSASTVQKAPRRLPAPKRRSWSKRGPCWPLRSMWKSLSCHSAWADAVGEVEPGHLLVADLGVEADHLGVRRARRSARSRARWSAAGCRRAARWASARARTACRSPGRLT